LELTKESLAIAAKAAEDVAGTITGATASRKREKRVTLEIKEKICFIF
jgi:hypothetical protein